MDASRVTPAAAAASPAVRAARALRDVSRFGRFSVLGFSLIVPLSGAAVTTPSLAPSTIAWLVAAAFAFHVFGYVSNDVFDLAIDSTQPLRAGSPLVRGLMRPAVALAIALVPVPAVCAVHLWLGRPRPAAAALLAGMAFGLIYNAYGKRLPFPPASDAIQGVAWVGLMLYGALAQGGRLSPAVFWLGATVFAYVLLVNGLHGGVRDLENDSRHGARTTARYFGARSWSDGRRVIPGRLMAYGLGLHVLLFLFPAICVVAEAPALRRGSWLPIVAAMAIAHVLLLRLARASFRTDVPMREVIRLGTAHLFLSMGAVFLPFTFFADRVAALVIAIAYAAPFLIALPYLGIVRGRRGGRGVAVGAAVILSLAPSGVAEAGHPPRLVPRQEIADAMAVEKSKGYELLATPNGARFAAGVALELARKAAGRDPLRAPLLLDHRDYFEAFVAVAGVGRESAPPYIREAFDHREDQLIDYRQENVIAAVRRGRRPRLALNVITGWTGEPSKYSYEDHDSDPPLRVTRERITSYRLVDFGDVLLFDDIEGISGRALGGLLGLLFRVIGEGHAVRSLMAVASDGSQVTLTTGRKGPVVLTTTATVDPRGRGERGVPDGRADLRALERRLKEPFEAAYAPLGSVDPSLWRR